ncbi:MAG TPA: DUF4235 domain-containing protein [Solirubrobacteraceae bacterium]|jgi:hypothetical protein|nr:DUF4235 domain-containing protein [Solirubrobacteraceae bacterium]
MAKLIFKPVGLLAGLISGLIGKKLFQRIWGAIDEQQPPKPQQRLVPLGKLALALALEGALFRVVKGLAEHGSRRAFSRLTGSWPGESRPRSE